MAPAPMLTRRGLLAAASVAALPHLPARAAVPALPFVVIGDWGRFGADQQGDVATAMGTTAAAMASRFVISVGDNFYEDGVTGLDDPHWQGSFERIYTAPSLQVPWRVILGNHDYRGNIEAQMAYSGRSPRWHLPARYYALSETLPDGGRADFFYVDTSPFVRKYRGSRTRIDGQDTAVQLAWLDAALGASDATWKIVIGHHPIHTTLLGDDHRTPELVAQLDPLLRRHFVHVYINGHDHTMQYVDRDGIGYITSGAGSQTYVPGPAVQDGFLSDAHGFLRCTLDSEALGFGFVDMTGRTIFASVIRRS